MSLAFTRVSMKLFSGTPGQVYRMTLVAAPALQFISITPDLQTGNVKLEWERYTGQAQVELATNVPGPYFPLSSVTTNLSFTDEGALTNLPQSFYRLRQY